MPLKAVSSISFLPAFPVLQGISSSIPHPPVVTSEHLLEATELLSWIETSESVSADTLSPPCFDQVSCHSSDRK